MMAQVRLATELDQIERCAPVMRELRTSLTESKMSSVFRSNNMRVIAWRLWKQKTLLSQ